jgi:hypothetical protein
LAGNQFQGEDKTQIRALPIKSISIPNKLKKAKNTTLNRL